MADVKEYFNRMFAVQSEPTATDIDRAHVIANLIPADVKSVLDVGCGTGLVTREIAMRYPVVGVELSKTGVATVRSMGIECCQGNVSRIPRADRSADLVLASEVLEHLDDSLYAAARRELPRVADRYILITVPNQDYFPYLRQECPRCRSMIVPWGHIRSFNHTIMPGLFAGFELCELREFGPRIVNRGSLLSRLLSWPESLQQPLLYGMICSICKYQELKHKSTKRPTIAFAIRHPFSTFTHGLRFLSVRLSPKCPRWLLALYQRSGRTLQN